MEIRYNRKISYAYQSVYSGINGRPTARESDLIRRAGLIRTRIVVSGQWLVDPWVTQASPVGHHFRPPQLPAGPEAPLLHIDVICGAMLRAIVWPLFTSVMSLTAPPVTASITRTYMSITGSTALLTLADFEILIYTLFYDCGSRIISLTVVLTVKTTVDN